MKAPLLIPILVGLLASCGTMQRTAQVPDDVYDLHTRAVIGPATTSVDSSALPSEEYFDPAQAGQYEEGNYYDVTYNDPQYYNYDRFGFGYGGGSNWSVDLGYNWGYGSPYGNSWNMGIGYGYGSGMYGSSPYDPWYDPFWNSHYGYGYGSGYGYGYGNPCYACYQPVTFCGGENASNVVHGHRPTMGAGGGTGGTGEGATTTTFSQRSRVSLMPKAMEGMRPASSSGADGPSRGTSTHQTKPAHPSGPEQRTRTSTERQTGERSAPSTGGDTPSRSGGSGGGSTPSTGHRPR